MNFCMSVQQELFLFLFFLNFSVDPRAAAAVCLRIDFCNRFVLLIPCTEKTCIEESIMCTYILATEP